MQPGSACRGEKTANKGLVKTWPSRCRRSRTGVLRGTNLERMGKCSRVSQEVKQLPHALCVCVCGGVLCVYVCMCICVYMYVYVGVHACVPACMYVCACRCVCVCVFPDYPLSSTL